MQTPTAEQAAILTLEPISGKVALISAIAGSGKTRTLRMYAETHPEENILYLCFNKAQADEARATFPPNATCRTTHSLAFSQVGFRFTDNPGKPFGFEPRVKTIQAILNLRSIETAQLVSRTLTNFIQSAAPKPGSNHIPGYAYTFANDDQREILLLVEQLWKRIIDPADTNVPVSHDAYVKLWQLGVEEIPTLPLVLEQYDVILVDEAQDINPAFEAIIRQVIDARQHTAILVGDERQAIYGWRGAINMMQRLDAEIRNGTMVGEIFTLTESFRYGPRTARLASKILAIGHGNGDETVQIKGRGTDDQNASGSHCYLARTNATLIEHTLALAANGSGGHVHFAATRAQEEWHPRVAYKFDALLSVFGQYSNRRGLITDPEIRRFSNWSEIRAHVNSTKQTGRVDLVLIAAVKFIERYRYEVPQVLQRLGNHCGPPEGAITTVSTVHRAKGLEWDRVTLLDDFPCLAGNDKEDWSPPDTEELNLLYVAITRGRHWVKLNPDLEQFFDSK